MMLDLLAFAIRLLTGLQALVGLPDDGKRRLYFANHGSHLDFAVLWAALPAKQRRWTRPVAAAEYWEAGAVRRWLATRVFDAVLIPRTRSRMKAEDPVGRMIEAIDGGSDLIFFPEGTRSSDGTMAPFKSGLHRVASARPDLLFLPVYLENLGRIMPKGELFPIPLMGRAVFGLPLPGLGQDEPRERFLQRAQAAVIELAGGNLMEHENGP